LRAIVASIRQASAACIAVSFDDIACFAAAKLSSTVAPQLCELIGSVVSARDDGGASSSADAIRIRNDNERLRKPDNFPR
jgi:hypothetical protein